MKGRVSVVNRVELSLVLTILIVAAGCARNGARDVAGDRRARSAGLDGGASPIASVPEPPRSSALPAFEGKKAKGFAKASTRALAIDDTNLYYGDTYNDSVYSAAKRGGEPVRLSRHAPVAGALALDATSLVWVASPGDAVLRMPLAGIGQPTTLRERGIFSDVAIVNGVVFIAEAVGAGGLLTRVNGTSTSRVASFEGTPRAVLADAQHAYVVVPTKVMRVPHASGELASIATGAGFATPQIDESFIYVLSDLDGEHVIGRIPKQGGLMTVIARGARDAPFEISSAEVLYLDAAKPQVRAVPVGGGEMRIVVEDERLGSANALVADSETVYVAVGIGESGAILAVERR